MSGGIYVLRFDGELLPLGSGLIEGACKAVVGKRPEHGRARRRRPRVENVATSCCLVHRDERDTFRQAGGA